ncbi:MAG TPA: hypothetical protein PLP07_13990 [Pyrinomonadaceae bacterium]|nr:hypothetical protein [Chloracidobacterium sp.]MBP9935251.1 hypothetical protein [Pyrinomonadaceae bacterium]MBK9438249.1 hypothetical protein [Chloracidobacterium sp.]MBK9767660.1 hypothetical protein [Chloracidobacterium sp.]MBL0240870.1 hypothetical protein [Chloracidobacterium sp.]
MNNAMRNFVSKNKELFVLTFAGYALVYANLGQSQILQGLPEEGESNLEKAVLMSGGNTDPALFSSVLSSLVDAYLKAGNQLKAIENMKRLIYLQPGNIKLRLKFAEELITSAQFQNAVIELQKILQQNQSNAAAWSMLGTSYRGSGK